MGTLVEEVHTAIDPILIAHDLELQLALKEIERLKDELNPKPEFERLIGFAATKAGLSRVQAYAYVANLMGTAQAYRYFYGNVDSISDYAYAPVAKMYPNSVLVTSVKPYPAFSPQDVIDGKFDRIFKAHLDELPTDKDTHNNPFDHENDRKVVKLKMYTYPQSIACFTHNALLCREHKNSARIKTNLTFTGTGDGARLKDHPVPAELLDVVGIDAYLGSVKSATKQRGREQFEKIFTAAQKAFPGARIAIPETGANRTLGVSVGGYIDWLQGAMEAWDQLGEDLAYVCHFSVQSPGNGWDYICDKEWKPVADLWKSYAAARS